MVGYAPELDFPDETHPTRIDEREELEMSHVEYTREDSRKDRAASFLGLAAGVGWVLIVGAIAYFIAVRG